MVPAGDPARGAGTVAVPGGPDRTGWVLAIVVALTLLPLLVAAAVLARRGWVPVGELAQAELRVRDFWSHPPSLGAVGRLRTDTHVSSHPGPAAWWAMYPVYALFGRSAGALSLAVAAVAGAWSAGGLALVWRRAGDRAVALAGIVVLGLFAALGPLTFLEPWNPWFAVMPFFCVVLGTWDLLEGHPWSLLLVVGAGSYAVQAHFGYAPLVAVLALAGVAGLLWGRHRRGERLSELLVPVLAAVGLGGLMWVLPVLEQLRNDPGNFTVVWQAYRQEAQRQEIVGLLDGARLVAARLDVLAPLEVGQELPADQRSPGVGAVLSAVAWAGTTWVAWRRRREPMMRSVLALDTAAAVGLLAAVAAASRIAGDVFGYLVLWLPVLVAVAVFAVLWTGWLMIGEVTGLQRAATWAIAAGLLVQCAVVTARFSDPPTPAEQLSRTTFELEDEVTSRLDEDARYLVRWDDPLAFGAIGQGLLSEMERRGYDAGADAHLSVEVRPHRVLDPSDADAAVWAVTGAAIDRWRHVEGVEELAYADPRNDRERAESAALRRDILAELRSIGGADLADRLEDNYWATREDPRVPESLAERIDRLAALGLPTAVFLADPDTAEP